MQKKIEQIFDNLDRWRHLPSYQLERRADILFSVYLPDILRAEVGREPIALIPEFPIHIPTIHPEMKGNLSFKVDYLAVFNDPKGVAFVELKTDPHSRRDEQDDYLARAQRVGMTNLLVGLTKIYAASASKGKYDQLLFMLSNAGLITWKGNGNIEPVVDLPEPRIIYIQPRQDPADKRIIAFEKVAELIAANNDALSRRFAESLREWSGTKAGDWTRETDSLPAP